MSGRPRNTQTTLHVTGFSHGTRAKDLAYEFERYGRLVRCDIPAPRNNATKLFAFVEYERHDDAADAYEYMHNKTFGGREDILKIEWARAPPNPSWRTGEDAARFRGRFDGPRRNGRDDRGRDDRGGRGPREYRDDRRGDRGEWDRRGDRGEWDRRGDRGSERERPPFRDDDRAAPRRPYDNYDRARELSPNRSNDRYRARSYDRGDRGDREEREDRDRQRAPSDEREVRDNDRRDDDRDRTPVSPAGRDAEASRRGGDDDSRDSEHQANHGNQSPAQPDDLDVAAE